ncbi:hypothetical protein [Streptomyces sp. NPDC048191]|uniref:wHTH domain-containing protein n=1 Tax=Streptomyces sp. NPDC048191 TaxID=3155484 RepID=UPI0033EADCF7
MAGAPRYEEHLQGLWEAAGEPSAESLSDRVGVPARRIDDWLACRVVPRRGDRVRVFVQTLESLARERSREPLSSPPSYAWDRLRDEARRRLQARRPAAPPAAGAGGVRREWLRAAEGSQAWNLIAPAAADQVEQLRELTLEAVSRLAELHEAEREVLLQDPWYDPGLARRTARWTNLRLTDIKSRLDKRTLAPAEAALLVLLPFLHDVHSAWTLTVLHHVTPEHLDDRTPGGKDRQGYNRVLLDHKRLIRQAMRAQRLPDRSDGRPEIGWWLFHQWVKAQPGRLDDVLDAMGVVADDMGAVLDPALLGRLLSCAHLGPRELFGGKPDGPSEEPFSVDFDGCDAQTVRERLVGPLFAIAHAMAIEVTDLPSTVVKHVAIPNPVDPGQLLSRLEEVQWNPLGDALALDAKCDHPAVVAALTEHAQYVDALLREARRTRPEAEIGCLPVYAHADGVREVDERDEPRQAGEVIRFRLDEERIQELLMGENLYRDRSLAIRELYQNALDACRYRRAYEYHQNGRDTFQGEITFRQGFDKEEQRYFLECRDNGIGMDEALLSEVFSRAGVRFSDHARHRELPWLADAEGIKVRPNSRFGIGVLSYFMLADEIRVTTRSLATGSAQPEELTVLITGPGHYFRVSRTGERRGRVGTTVRLYLRDEDNAPSCVRELRRLLGIAEFETRAFHGAREAMWDPGLLKPRQTTAERADGVVAYGRRVSWPPEDDVRRLDGQVVWCEHGGGILADGIFIEPRVRRGVLAGPAKGSGLRGVVVNLTGRSRPKNLSVDRAEILDPDVDTVVEELIRDALPALIAADPALLTREWLAGVAETSPRLADIVTEAAGEEGVVLRVNGYPAPMATVGYFPPDVTLVHGRGRDTKSPGTTAFDSDQEDVILLWRLLAHRPNTELEALTGVVPELSHVRGVLPARPSDVLTWSADFRDYPSNGRPGTAGTGEHAAPGRVLSVALASGVSYEEVLSRLEQLGLPVPPRPSAPVALDATTAVLLEEDLQFDGSLQRYTGLKLKEPVPPGHLVKAALELNIGIGEAADRMKALGFRVPETMRPETPEDWVVRLLSHRLHGSRPWLSASERVRAGHVLRGVCELGRELPEIVERLQEYGLRPEVGSLDGPSARELLRLSAEWGWDDSVGSLDTSRPMPPGFLVRASLRSGAALSDIARRLGELGFSTDVLPDQVAATDEALLGARDYFLDTPLAGEKVFLHDLVQGAADSGLSPKEAAVRLRAYGLLPQYGALPDDLAPGDLEILTCVYRTLPRGEDDLSTCTVPMFAVVDAAVDARVSPQAVMDCLHRYGVRTSHSVAPVKARRYDTDLIRLKTRGDYLDWGTPVPLFHLAAVPTALLVERDEAIGRLAELGLEVPAHELAGLSEADLSLCRDSFGPERNALPLELRHPLVDFLEIVLRVPLPLEELLLRLTRLGVDLPRVAEVVRAALPHVPGLVMATGNDGSEGGTRSTTATARPSRAT